MAQSSGDELFTTSWTLHRLSPLYHGEECQTLLGNPQGLKVYADRLRDILRGDTFRGVQIGIDGVGGALDDAASKAGPLQTCKWETLPTWRHWNEEHSLLEDPEEGNAFVIAPDEAAGIIVTFNYESAVYKAALLTGPDGYRDDTRKKGTTYLPLLITRLPNSLRQMFISFLGMNFDTRCSILRLPSSFMCAALENYIAALNSGIIGRNGGSSDSSRSLIESVIKETQLTLSFPPPISPSLKTLDVLLPRTSLSTFFMHGSSRTDSTRSVHNPSSPFLSTLSSYFDNHLAMKLDLSEFRETATPSEKRGNQNVRLSKISCGAFVLGSEGRMKLLSNPGRVLPFDDEDMDDEDEEDEEDIQGKEARAVWRANEGLLRALVQRAIGGRNQVDAFGTRPGNVEVG